MSEDRQLQAAILASLQSARSQMRPAYVSRPVSRPVSTYVPRVNRDIAPTLPRSSSGFTSRRDTLAREGILPIKPARRKSTPAGSPATGPGTINVNDEGTKFEVPVRQKAARDKPVLPSSMTPEERQAALGARRQSQATAAAAPTSATAAAPTAVAKSYQQPVVASTAQSTSTTQQKPPTTATAKGSHDEKPAERPPFKGEDKEFTEIVERNIIDRSLGVTWDTIAGLGDAKRLLKEAVVLPQLMPEYFTGIREPWKGVLLFGPPGTGKTMLAKAVATEAHTTFFNCSAAALVSKWHGQSEKMVRCLFAMARYYSPSTVFFDEIDAIGTQRGSMNEHEASRRLKAELLQQIDGVVSGSEQEGVRVMVLATTNCPWDLDDALRRRLEKRIYIPLPDASGRAECLRLYLKDVKLQEDVQVEQLVAFTDGYSGADLKILCRDASMMQIRRLMADMDPLKIKELADAGQLDNSVSMNDFTIALRNTKPSGSKTEAQRYEQWSAEFGCR
eukprot:TRINITY_DN6853_c0_g1_i1.p1 TRINITY_DN6853_c0_g1~~TRINITY_DN6853_c0_g1_i1.p1  ORF type:complete len:504 (+),score=119.89 TRINITY_DN6853_c0_g1_i1:123-1634(+)